MTEQFYGTKVNNVDHRTYGGEIYESDFCTNHASNSNVKRGSTIAARIIKAKNFDMQCKKNVEQQRRNTVYKKYNWNN